MSETYFESIDNSIDLDTLNPPQLDALEDHLWQIACQTAGEGGAEVFTDIRKIGRYINQVAHRHDGETNFP